MLTATGEVRSATMSAMVMRRGSSTRLSRVRVITFYIEQVRCQARLTPTDEIAVAFCLLFHHVVARAGTPDSTYRLQFNKAFTFNDARAIVEYLHALGISHCYASSYLTAVPGS